MIEINHNKLETLSKYLTNLPNVKPFDFCSVSPGIIYPDINSNFVINFFFFVTLHQFGFWLDDKTKYIKPFYGIVDGNLLKGSDFMWRISMKASAKQPELFNAGFLANLTFSNFNQLFCGDTENCILPMLEKHYQLSVDYGKDLIKLNLEPNDIVQKVNDSSNPAKTFLSYLNQITGYKEDPLKKKALLLILILINRPERLVNIYADDKNLKPIVDYHIQRSMLRTGILKFTDKDAEFRNTNRLIITEEEEAKIRNKAYEAFESLLKHSGRTLGELDYFFFTNRKNCPEMEFPDCDKCILNKICSKKTELFQPVFRTTYY